MRTGQNGSQEFFEENPDRPYKDTLIVSSQPGLLDDYKSGLHETRFWIHDIVPLQSLAVKYTLELHCDVTVSPWCS